MADEVRYFNYGKIVYRRPGTNGSYDRWLADKWVPDNAHPLSEEEWFNLQPITPDEAVRLLKLREL
jgi:hypothetical protein